MTKKKEWTRNDLRKYFKLVGNGMLKNQKTLVEDGTGQ